MGYSKRVSIPRADYPATLTLEALTRIKAAGLPVGLQPSKVDLAIDLASANDAEARVARIRLELEAEGPRASRLPQEMTFPNDDPTPRLARSRPS